MSGPTAPPWQGPYARVLTESATFVVFHLWESVYLGWRATERKLEIGWFYGDPVAAAIDGAERWLVVVGCGLVVYDVRALQETFRREHRDFESVEWVSEGLFRVVDEEGLVWDLDAQAPRLALSQ